MKILVLNAGSSTHKFGLYDITNNEPVNALWEGKLDWGKDPSLKQENLWLFLKTLWEGDKPVLEGPEAIEAIGHRVVHGGRNLQEPTLITTQVKEEIKSLIPLAPLHNPANLEGIELMQAHFPNLPQVAVFDTGFHKTMPDVAKIYPVPLDWYKDGIQRYGFHGISHHYCAERIPRLLNRESSELKIINCHLGNGCSLCAIQDGKSVDTTMGFTPMEGLMMGTRCGTIDPGILLYLLQEKRITAEKLDHILNFESGLKGISGFSDMRQNLEENQASSQLAVNMFIYRLKAFIGALAPSLNGLNALSFTGGIGENAPLIRQRVCEGLKFLGIQLDLEKNKSEVMDQDIAQSQSSVRVVVIHTREEWMIAKAIWKMNSL